MRFFSKFFSVAFVTFALLFTGYSFYLYSLRPCDKALEYSIGRFDTEFGVSKEEFKSHIVVAEKVWEKALGRDVFVYDPDATFKINLIYDERQLSTVQKQKTEFGLEAVENVLEQLDAEFKTMKAAYQREVDLHEAATATFEQKQKEYAAGVDYWNSRGGAPKKEYENLQKEALVLNAEAIRLNEEAASLNVASQELNALLERRNLAAREYNKVAASYNRKFGAGLEFDQAEYNSKGINVYQFGDEEDLDLALAHELGHALGMDHTESSGSIMYYLTGGNDEISLVPTKDDLAELSRVCQTR